MTDGRLRAPREEPAAFALLLAPPVLCLLFLFVLPMALVWLVSFAGRGPQGQILALATLENYARALEPIHLFIIAKSLAIAAATTVACLTIGLPMALLIAFAPARWKNLLLLLVMLPFWTNLLVRTYSWIALLRSEGLVNRAWEMVHGGVAALLGGFGMAGVLSPFGPVEFLYNNGATVLGLVHVHLPFLVLPAYVALEKVDRNCLESSLDLGATMGQTLRLIVLPAALPGIATGALLTLILTMGALVTSDLLGGTDGLMIGNLIHRQFTTSNDWPFGSALSFLLIYATFVLVALRAAWRSWS